MSNSGLARLSSCARCSGIVGGRHASAAAVSPQRSAGALPLEHVAVAHVADGGLPAVDAQEAAQQDEEAAGHDPNLDGNLHGALVVQVVRVEGDAVEEEDRVAAQQQRHGERAVGVCSLGSCVSAASRCSGGCCFCRLCSLSDGRVWPATAEQASRCTGTD